MQNAATVPCRSLLSKASQVPSAQWGTLTYSYHVSQSTERHISFIAAVSA